MLHTARRRESSVRVQKRVRGWIVEGRYGAWVDYIFHGGVSARGAATRPCGG